MENGTDAEATGTSGQEAIARRILRLEERLDLLDGQARGGGPAPHPAWALALGCGAAAFGLLGMGAPSHPYQHLFAGLLLVLAYHRGFLRPAVGAWQWPQAAVNYLNGSLLLVIALGGGIRHPFEWFRTPELIKNPPPDGGSWYGAVVPDYSVQWTGVRGFSDWTLDLTKVQVFLLIALLAGALFRAQGFSSIIAACLLLVSVPAYLSFDWDWVVLFLVLGSISFYIQSRMAFGPRTGR